MTCPECKYEWCWLCKAKCEKGHFKIGGACYGLQFTKKDCWNNCLFLYGYKFLMWFGFSYDNPWQDKYPKFLYYTTVCFLIISFFIIYTALGALFFLITIPGYCLKNKALAFLLDLMGL